MFEQGDSSNRLLDWTVAPFCNFYSIIWVGFTLTQENAFSYRFNFKANRKGIGSPKKWYKAFLAFLTLTFFYVTVTGNFEFFQYFNFEIFWKTKTFLKKLQHCFVVENTMIESVTYPY